MPRDPFRVRRPAPAPAPAPAQSQHRAGFSDGQSRSSSTQAREYRYPSEVRHRSAGGGLTSATTCSTRVEAVITSLRRAWFTKRTVEEVMLEQGEPLNKRESADALIELQRRHDWRATLEVRLPSARVRLKHKTLNVTRVQCQARIVARGGSGVGDWGVGGGVDGGCLVVAAVVEFHLFGWMKRQPWFYHSAKLYTALIGFLGREGQPNLATCLFQEMLLERQEPNHYTYTGLISGYGRALMFDEALAVFEHMKSTDEYDCRQANPPARPSWYAHASGRGGEGIGYVTCNALIGPLCKGGRYDRAVEIFFDMLERRNGLTESCRPSIVTYNMLIDALCREGHAGAALKMLEGLANGSLDAGVRLNAATYNTLVDACCKAGRAGDAEALVAGMRAHGVAPDCVTFTALIDAYGKAGLLEKVRQEGGGWRRRERLGEGKGGRGEGGGKAMMMAAGVSADVLTYTALISACGRAGHLVRAEQLFADMRHLAGLRPNDVTYLALIDSYAKEGCYAKAEALFLEMKVAGFRPNVYAYSALLAAYGKASMHRQVARTFEAMRADGCRPNLVTYAALLAATGRCRTWEDALKLLYCLQRSASKTELAMCRLVLGAPGEALMWENAETMLESIKTHPRALQRSFYNALVDCLWSFGLRGRAARVLAAGRLHNVYGEECFQFAQRDWFCDLHDNSVGAAVSLLFAWFLELRQAWEWGEEVPNRIYIVTGWGKHRKKGPPPPAPATIGVGAITSQEAVDGTVISNSEDTSSSSSGGGGGAGADNGSSGVDGCNGFNSSQGAEAGPNAGPVASPGCGIAATAAGWDPPLKHAVETELRQLASPFLQDLENSGRIVATGVAVREWLMQAGMAERLELLDSQNPSPAVALASSERGLIEEP
eukprot:jgi/Mesen1/5392/ME000268S04594